MFECEQCGRSTPKPRERDGKFYCSQTCLDRPEITPEELAQRIAEVNAKRLAKDACAGCGEPLPEGRHSSMRYCGRKCRQLAGTRRTDGKGWPRKETAYASPNP